MSLAERLRDMVLSDATRWKPAELRLINEVRETLALFSVEDRDDAIQRAADCIWENIKKWGDPDSAAHGRMWCYVRERWVASEIARNEHGRHRLSLKERNERKAWRS